MSKSDSHDISLDISTKFAAQSLEVYESQVRMEIAAMEEVERAVELEEQRDGTDNIQETCVWMTEDVWITSWTRLWMKELWAGPPSMLPPTVSTGHTNYSVSQFRHQSRWSPTDSRRSWSPTDSKRHSSSSRKCLSKWSFKQYTVSMIEIPV